MKVGIESDEWYPYYELVDKKQGEKWGEVIDLTKEEYDRVVEVLKEAAKIQRFLGGKYITAYEKRKEKELKQK